MLLQLLYQLGPELVPCYTEQQCRCPLDLTLVFWLGSLIQIFKHVVNKNWRLPLCSYSTGHTYKFNYFSWACTNYITSVLFKCLWNLLIQNREKKEELYIQISNASGSQFDQHSHLLTLKSASFHFQFYPNSSAGHLIFLSLQGK